MFQENKSDIPHLFHIKNGDRNVPPLSCCQEGNLLYHTSVENGVNKLEEIRARARQQITFRSDR